MNRRRVFAIVVLISVVGVTAWMSFVTHYTPAGQPPLAYLDAASLETLKADFNRAVGETRIVVLLAPT